MAVAAEPQRASLPLPGGSSGATVRLHPLLTATSLSPPAWLHREEGRRGSLRALGIGVSKSDYVEIPIVAFLVEHPGAGPILVDTGMHPSVAVDPKQNLGRVGARAFGGLRMEPRQAVVEQLRARGVEPGDVRLVVMTHLHIDHASSMSEFPNATFVFSAREWEAAVEPRSWQHGYRTRQFDHGFDYRTLDFEGPDADSYASFGRAFDLLGDGSVRALYTPGHTHGHMSVAVRLAGGPGEALLAGDAVYTRRALSSGELPFRVEDEHRYQRSVRELQIYVDQHPDALVIPGHDMEEWRKLAAVY